MRVSYNLVPVNDERDVDMRPAPTNQTQPVGAPTRLDGGVNFQPHVIPPDGSPVSSPIQPLPMPTPGGPLVPPPVQSSGVRTAQPPQGLSLYGLGGVPGYGPASWLQPTGRQMAGPWNPFQGRFSGLVRG